MPLSQGLLYLGPLYRLAPVTFTQPSETYDLDHTMLPPNGAIPPGVEVHFQLWFRDGLAGSGQGISNLSDVLTVCFTN